MCVCDYYYLLSSQSRLNSIYFQIEFPNKRKLQYFVMTKEREGKRSWSQEEDHFLKDCIDQSTPTRDGPINWNNVYDLFLDSDIFMPRTKKQCRERWLNVLKNKLQRHEKVWTIQDDIRLIQSCKENGHRWSLFSIEYGVNDNKIKNHFYCTVRKIVRFFNKRLKILKQEIKAKAKKKIRLTDEEIELEQICHKVRKFDLKNCSKIFSLLDKKQEFKYEAKETINIELIREVNDEILGCMEEYLRNNNTLDDLKIFRIVERTMNANKLVKLKHHRDCKMVIIDHSEFRKKKKQQHQINKKIDELVKKQLEGKIIPDKKTKHEILNKMENCEELQKIIAMKEKIERKERLKKARRLIRSGKFTIIKPSNKVEGEVKEEVQIEQNQVGNNLDKTQKQKDKSVSCQNGQENEVRSKVEENWARSISNFSLANQMAGMHEVRSKVEEEWAKSISHFSIENKEQKPFQSDFLNKIRVAQPQNYTPSIPVMPPPAFFHHGFFDFARNRTDSNLERSEPRLHSQSQLNNNLEGEKKAPLLHSSLNLSNPSRRFEYPTHNSMRLSAFIQHKPNMEAEVKEEEDAYGNNYQQMMEMSQPFVMNFPQFNMLDSNPFLNNSVLFHSNQVNKKENPQTISSTLEQVKPEENEMGEKEKKN